MVFAGIRRGPAGSEPQRGSRRLVSLVTAIAVSFLMFVPSASAGVRIENRMASEWVTNTAGVSVYPYGSGRQHVADFSTGTHNGTVNNGGSLELGGTSGDWWDTAWLKRQCFDVNASDARAEHPIRFEVDTSASTSDGDDIRVVATATNTVLESYSEGEFTGPASVVWGQAEPLPAGVSSYCVYFENPAAVSVSDEAAVFTYSSGQSVKYYTMFDTYEGVLLDDRVTVVSYSADNVVSADAGPAVTLQVGQLHTFTGLNKNSIISATGPISGSYDRPNKEALLPESFADSQFTFPTRRYVERFWIRSPHGNTTVEAIANGTVIGSVDVGPGSGSVELIADGGGTRFVTLRAFDGLDFLAVHSGTNNQDGLLGVPWFGDPLYGVASNNLNLASPTNTTVSSVSHTGTVQPNQAVSMNALTAIGNHGRFGDGRAYAITGTGAYFHAAQQADADGTEATSFLPRRLLSETYRLPVAARYYTVACPVAGTEITVDGTPAGICSGAGVGFFYGGFGIHLAGKTIEADNPIYVYYEGLTSRDEHNIFGAKASIPHLANLELQTKPTEMLAPQCGTWTSNPLPSAGVFGLFSAEANVPAGATATYQLSTDGSTFYGPDGTPTTFFGNGDVVPYAADRAATLQFRVELCAAAGGSPPSVTSLAVECELTEFIPDVDNTNTLAVDSATTPTNTPLLRVYQNEPGPWQSWVEFVDGTGLVNSDAIFSTDTPSTQVSVTAGAVSETRTPFSHQVAQPYSLLVEHSTISGRQSELELVLVDQVDVRIESGIRIIFAG